MTDAARNADDYCYRHPDRLSFVLCERCGRTICLECQTHVTGKVLCPDDAKVSNVTMLPVNQRPPRVKKVRTPPRWLQWAMDRVPPVTLSLMTIIGVLWIADLIVGLVEPYLWLFAGSLNVLNSTAYHGPLLGPWSVVTSMISNPRGGDGFLSVVFTLFSIFVIGRVLEPDLGRLKFLAAFMLSGLGASAFAQLFGGIVDSASDALFGMIAVFAVLMRRRGANMIWLYAVIAVNVVSILLSSSRAVIWQGALGGLAVGVGVGFALLLEPSPSANRRQRLILIAIGVGLVALIILSSVL